MNGFSGTTEIEQDSDPSTNPASASNSGSLDSDRSDVSSIKPLSFGGFEARLLQRLLRRLGDVPIRLVLPSGVAVSPDKQPPLATIKLRDRRSLWSLVTDPLYQFGELYANGGIQVEGDLCETLTAVYAKMKLRQFSTWSEQGMSFLHPPRSNSLIGSKDNIHHHYDLGNEFYRLWLDERMQYTCAYFAQPDFSLEEAQRAKLDHVCRKLRLQPGQKVVEAGCGWGGLARHMAQHYGVEVTAYNISAEQVAWAKSTTAQMGLSHSVTFIEDDWRNITGKFDAFVSVGMLEHVGLKNYAQLGRTIGQCLKPAGMALIHSIGQNQPKPMNAWIERRIFPGAYPPTLGQMMEIFEGPDFSILDVENLRLHYAETLGHWLDRFEQSRETILQQFDEKFIRMWQLYLASSYAAFTSGFLQLFQVVFAHGTSNHVPRTREHLHENQRVF